MDRIKELVAFTLKQLYKDWDSVIVVDGGEGTSKSTLGCWILDIFYGLRNGKVTAADVIHMCLTPEQFLEDLKDLKKYECTIYDEAGDILKRRSLSQFNVMIMKAYQVIRGDNLLTVLIMPSIFDLDNFFSKRRVKGLLHVYRRGRVSYYSGKRLRTLLAKNEHYPIKNYSVVKPTWYDTFPKYKGVLAKPYLAKKEAKMKDVRSELYEQFTKRTAANDVKPVFPEQTCLRCGYSWIPKTANPRKCPDCHTQYWRRENPLEVTRRKRNINSLKRE